MKFYLLNVFSKKGEAGNQLAAVFPDRKMTFEEMQSIAREFNFSETIFISDPEKNPSIKIFTPKSELPFAGHPTVGAAWILYHLGLQKNNFKITVPLGLVSVVVEDHGALITFPGTAKISSYQGNLPELLKHCRLEEKDIEKNDIRLVNVGPEFTVIPVKNSEALSFATSPINFTEPVKAYLVHKKSSSEYKVRMFSPALSVIEDAATGSAACALAAYLKNVKQEETGKVTISQGMELQRECEILLEWSEKIQVGGEVKLWGEGNLKGL